jgi:hypothetical protein
VTLLERVCRRLDDEGIAHALIGAAALASHGVARSTFDLDLLATDARILTAALWDPLRAPGLTIDIRRGDSDDPLAGVVRLEGDGQRPVDVVVGRWPWQARAVQRAERRGGTPPVVAARDLVLLKLYAGGTRDLWDVRELLALSGAGTLVADVDEDLRTLPADLRQRWAGVRSR